jgi:heat shock protein HslJ
MKGHSRWLIALIVFVGIVVTACSSSVGDGIEKTLFVAPVTVECEGAGPQRCNLVRENQDDEWGLFYDQIEGFEYEEGYLYELLVNEKRVDDPPVDASSLSLTLVEVVNQRPVAIKTVFIGPERVECEGEGPQSCYQYKENREDPWLLYYFDIQGFDYEEGFEYELLVAETNIENPPAGGSSTQLTLVQQIEKSEPAGDLIGTIWALTTLYGRPVVEGTEISMGISEDRIGGFAGCNNYSGAYEIEGNNIKIGPLASTMMMCLDPDIMEQEQLYLAAVGSATSYKILANRLELINGEGATAAMYTVAASVSLESQSWEVISYNNGKEAVVSVIIGSRIMAEFEGQQMNGSGGCNNYFGAYEADGENISIGPLANTEMFCVEPEGVMDQEQQYLAALQSVASYRIDGDRLEMRTADGALAVSMVAVEPVSLENRLWDVTAYNNGRGGFTTIIIGSELSMFFEGGAVSGSAGCNNYNAAYELEADNIKIGPAAATKKMCNDPEGVMDQEQEFLAALESVAQYKIDGDRIEMRTAEGSLAVGGVLGE